MINLNASDNDLISYLGTIISANSNKDMPGQCLQLLVSLLHNGPHQK